jgi:tetratricopeptide (TPR) repeat protein
MQWERPTLRERAMQMDEKLTYRQQVNFCGKPRCRKCRDGVGHGPYWYSYRVTSEGRTIRTYIGRNLPPGVTPDQIETNNDLPSANPTPVGTRFIASTPGNQGTIDTLTRQLAANPTDEETVKRLMIALVQDKRRVEALRVYRNFIAKSPSPSSSLQALYEAIQQGKPVDADFVVSDVVGRASSRPYRGTIPNNTTPDNETPAGTQFIASTTPERGTSRPYIGSDIQIGRINQSPLVGRSRELEELRQLLLVTEEATRRRGQNQRNVPATLELSRPQCLVLIGESGIGKTRLAEETAREARGRGWSVVWGHAYAQESGIPYRLWSEALRSLFEQGLLRGVTAQQLPPRIYTPLHVLLPELAELLPSENNSGQFSSYNHNPLSPEQEQVYLREAIYELLATLSAGSPLLIVLDDVQWADGSSSELLGYLARRLPDHPIVLLATSRETELSANTVLNNLLSHMQREHAVEYLRVQPLTDSQIADLVSYLPPEKVRHVQSQAAGNPFFAEELAYSIHAGAVAAQATNATSSQMLPKSVTAALDQRLNRLSQSCRHLLERAAVLGGSFSFPLISAMESNGSAIDEDTLFDLLEEALNSGLLTEEGSGSRIVYRFWHPLLASHLYNSLSGTRRARLHRRAAESLQKVFASREGEQAAAITEHFIQGGAEAPLIARYAELAANHAYALSAYPEAERQYRLAVQYFEAAHPASSQASLPLDERLRLAFLLERLAECLRIQGNFKEARQLFERVLHVRGPWDAVTSDKEQEAQIQALLWSEIGWTWRFTGDKERAWHCCKHGEQVLEQAGITTGPARARLRFQQSSLRWQEGQYEEAYRLASEALTLFNTAQSQPVAESASLTRIRSTLLGDPVDLGRTHAMMGAIANALGRPSVALDHMKQALDIYERFDRLREIAHVCCNIGYMHLKKAEYGLALAFLQRSLHLAERIGDRPLLSVVYHNLGELHAVSNPANQEEARSLFTRGLLLAEQINDREYLSLWNADLALFLLEHGYLEEAARCVKTALSIGRAMRNPPCISRALVALGCLHIACTRSTDNSAHLKRASASLTRALALQGLDVETRTKGLLALAEVSLLSNQKEQARKEATQALQAVSQYELVDLAKRCQRVLDACS